MKVRFNPVVAIVMLVVGALCVFLGLWLFLLGEFSPALIAGLMPLLIGILYLVRPYFWVYSTMVRVPALIGPVKREFPLQYLEATATGCTRSPGTDPARSPVAGGSRTHRLGGRPGRRPPHRLTRRRSASTSSTRAAARPPARGRAAERVPRRDRALDRQHVPDLGRQRGVHTASSASVRFEPDATGLGQSHAVPRRLVRHPERDALADQPLGDVRGQGEPRWRQFGHARRGEPQRADHPRDRRQQHSSCSTESNSGSLSSCRSRLYASGWALSTASSPVRLPISRPDLPRVSSATSGFFFCGMIELPVAQAFVEDRVGELAVVQMITSSRSWTGSPEHGQAETDLRREVAGRDAVDRVLGGGGEPQLLRHGLGVEASEEPASAPDPYDDTAARPVPVPQPVEVAQQRLDVGQQVVRQQHRLGVLQVGPAA